MLYNQVLEARRSHYQYKAEIPITDEELQKTLAHAISYAPSPFNNQSSRVVLLKGDEHRALWDLTLETLRRITPPEVFPRTQAKIAGLRGAYGSLLFFEDQDTVAAYQAKFPLYAEQFTVWSEQHAGIVQFAVWLAFADVGIGATVQHYNPLIDDDIKARWPIPKSWKLRAQMPFGQSTDVLGEKSFMPINERLLMFG